MILLEPLIVISRPGTMFTKVQAPVFQRLDNAIHRINHCPADSVVCFVNTYPLDSDLSGGQCYPPFEQPGPELHQNQILLNLGIDTLTTASSFLLRQSMYQIYSRRPKGTLKNEGSLMLSVDNYCQLTLGNFHLNRVLSFYASNLKFSTKTDILLT